MIDRDIVLKLMEKRGLNQSELADKIGVSRSMVCHFLNGKRDMNEKQIGFLCEALECTPNDLYGVKTQK